LNTVIEKLKNIYKNATKLSLSIPAALIGYTVATAESKLSAGSLQQFT
jgi:hypothetical protein